MDAAPISGSSGSLPEPADLSLGLHKRGRGAGKAARLAEEPEDMPAFGKGSACTVCSGDYYGDCDFYSVKVTPAARPAGASLFAWHTRSCMPRLVQGRLALCSVARACRGKACLRLLLQVPVRSSAWRWEVMFLALLIKSIRASHYPWHSRLQLIWCVCSKSRGWVHCVLALVVAWLGVMSNASCKPTSSA